MELMEHNLAYRAINEGARLYDFKHGKLCMGRDIWPSRVNEFAIEVISKFVILREESKNFLPILKLTKKQQKS